MWYYKLNAKKSKFKVYLIIQIFSKINEYNIIFLLNVSNSTLIDNLNDKFVGIFVVQLKYYTLYIIGIILNYALADLGIVLYCYLIIHC